MKSLSGRICPRTAKAIPPFLIFFFFFIEKQQKFPFCFSKRFQLCARPPWRAVRALCALQVWGQPRLVGAEKFLHLYVHPCPACVPMSPSICHSSLCATVRSWKGSSLKSTILMWDFNADLLILFNQSFLFHAPHTPHSPSSLTKQGNASSPQLQPSIRQGCSQGCPGRKTGKWVKISPALVLSLRSARGSAAIPPSSHWW